MEGMVDAIREGEIVRMSALQARDEDLFVLRNVVEKSPEVVVPKVEKINKETSYGYESPLDKWKMRRPGFRSNNVIKDLVENFHWEILRARRGKNMSRKQLANALEISEEDMKMIEFGDLPKDDFVFINKIEGFLGITLRKEKLAETVSLADLQKMNESRVRKAIERVHKGEAGKTSGSEGFSGDDIEILD